MNEWGRYRASERRTTHTHTTHTYTHTHIHNTYTTHTTHTQHTQHIHTHNTYTTHTHTQIHTHTYTHTHTHTYTYTYTQTHHTQHTWHTAESITRERKVPNSKGATRCNEIDLTAILHYNRSFSCSYDNGAINAVGDRYVAYGSKDVYLHFVAWLNPQHPSTHLLRCKKDNLACLICHQHPTVRTCLVRASEWECTRWVSVVCECMRLCVCVCTGECDFIVLCAWVSRCSYLFINTCWRPPSGWGKGT